MEVGALYQHLSNGGQTDPNPSLNLFGPQVGRHLLVLIPSVMSSEVETSRDETMGIATGFLDFAVLRSE